MVLVPDMIDAVVFRKKFLVLKFIKLLSHRSVDFLM